MSSTQRRRLFWIVLFVFLGGGAVSLTLFALSQNINLFYTPTQIVQGEAPQKQTIRVGGVVVPGSVERAEDSLKIQFDLTDTIHVVTVTYEGILPDLFREGQGIIALGEVNQAQIFSAIQVLAKHDETYMPPEVADMLKQAGAHDS